MLPMSNFASSKLPGKSAYWAFFLNCEPSKLYLSAKILSSQSLVSTSVSPAMIASVRDLAYPRIFLAAVLDEGVAVVAALFVDHAEDASDLINVSLVLLPLSDTLVNYFMNNLM